jgi:hypothetical protein
MSNRIAVLKREEGIDRPLGLSHPQETDTLHAIDSQPFFSNSGKIKSDIWARRLVGRNGTNAEEKNIGR